MDVPFISWDPLSVQLGTDAIAPPGALILTPSEPSVLYSTILIIIYLYRK
jgi:hypothetical protein